MTIERTREVWSARRIFRQTKVVYPEHAMVQEFAANARSASGNTPWRWARTRLSYLRRLCRVWYVDVVPETSSADDARVQVNKRTAGVGLVLNDSAPIPLWRRLLEYVQLSRRAAHIADP